MNACYPRCAHTMHLSPFELICIFDYQPVTPLLLLEDTPALPDSVHLPPHMGAICCTDSSQYQEKLLHICRLFRQQYMRLRHVGGLGGFAGSRQHLWTFLWHHNVSRNMLLCLVSPVTVASCQLRFFFVTSVNSAHTPDAWVCHHLNELHVTLW